LFTMAFLFHFLPHPNLVSSSWVSDMMMLNWLSTLPHCGYEELENYPCRPMAGPSSFLNLIYHLWCTRNTGNFWVISNRGTPWLGSQMDSLSNYALWPFIFFR
jgi:hypothetical protein